jgi:hypothetical protein
MSLNSERGPTASSVKVALPPSAPRSEERGTVDGGGDHAVRHKILNVGSENDIVVVRLGGEVPQGVGVAGDVREAPHELLDGVVVREADLLGGGGIDGVGTSVLHLLDQVLVTLLGEAATLLGVEVDVVSPHLEGVGVAVGGEIGREVDVDADLVVLERDEGEVETGVAVEEEEEGEVDGLTGDTSGHLTVRSLLGLVEVKLGVQTPPLLVVLVDTLTTDGKLNVVDGALGDPAGSGRSGGGGEEFDVHVADEITVTGDSHGHATGVGGSTVDGLLDVLHREVGVALVFRLEEGHLRVTGKVNILGTVSYELHETTGHFESCCTISRENNFRGTRISRPQFFSVYNKCRNSLMKLKKGKLNKTNSLTRRKGASSRLMRMMRWIYLISSEHFSPQTTVTLYAVLS